MKVHTLLLSLFLLIGMTLISQNLSIYEENVNMKTYMFSDPDPVAEPGRLYPYFRFDAYTNKAVDKEWKMVILENDYIKVFVCPEIGGKVWGAFEKSTGKEFLYYNHVVKFRDIAMRGPWTSGGLEYNFGDIGHIPSCATPVDYVIKDGVEGQVSCVVSSYDLPSRTRWNVEIILEENKAYFETKVSWFNMTDQACTYYHWMNAAAKAAGNLEFIAPGNMRIGHGGEIGDWPKENGRNISYYEENNFGPYKSYHIVNASTDYFGGYWHDDDFGFGHWASHDEKVGKKLWIWGLSDQGMIWEDLLTDKDGQYIEYQAGKLYNQAAQSSTYTPFKHREFKAADSDIMHELWFPVVGTKGIDAATPWGVFNVDVADHKMQLYFSPLRPVQDTIYVISEDIVVESFPVNLQPLELYSVEIKHDPALEYTIILGDKLLSYNSDPYDKIVNRPLYANTQFDWESAYGWYVKGLEFEKQRMYSEAEDAYQKSLEKEKTYSPSLNKMAVSLYRKLNYPEALRYLFQSMSYDTYDPEANYYYGLIHLKQNNMDEAVSGFSIAAASVEYRSAAYTQLAVLNLKQKNYQKSVLFAKKALNFNAFNISALEVLASSYRKLSDTNNAINTLDKIYQLDPTYEFISFEKYLLRKGDMEKSVIHSVQTELAEESFMELAIKYFNRGMTDEAIQILRIIDTYPLPKIWQAYLDIENRNEHLDALQELSMEFVFAFRDETAIAIKQLLKEEDRWPLKYQLALIYWNKGMITEAKKLYDDCANEADFPAFYLTKAKLNDDPEIKKACYQKALELEPENWRATLLLAGVHLDNNHIQSSEELILPILKKYPENAKLGMQYAKILIAGKEFKKSIDFLKDFKVLPYEGSTDGRIMYHTACIRFALECLNEGQFKLARKYAKMAKEWPINLGAGRPYDVNENMDDYIIAMSWLKSGNEDKAESQFQHILDSYENRNQDFTDSKIVFKVFAYRHMNMEDSAGLYLQDLIDNQADNNYLNWVQACFTGDLKDAERIKNEIITQGKKALNYDISKYDPEFELVSYVVESLLAE